MGLIKYNDIEMLSNHELSDSHTVSHEGDFGLRATFFLKPDIVADLFS